MHNGSMISLLKAHHIRKYLLPIGCKIKIRKGSYLRKINEPIQSFFVVTKGFLQSHHSSKNGKECFVRDYGISCIIDGAYIFSDIKQYGFDVIAILDSEVIEIEKNQFQSVILNNEELIKHIFHSISHQSNNTEAKVRNQALYGKKGLLFFSLLKLAMKYGQETEQGTMIGIPLTNQDLANYCGLSRENTNRLINELRKNKIISIQKTFITIHKMEYIESEIDMDRSFFLR